MQLGASQMTLERSGYDDRSYSVRIVPRGFCPVETIRKMESLPTHRMFEGSAEDCYGVFDPYKSRHFAGIFVDENGIRIEGEFHADDPLDDLDYTTSPTELSLADRLIIVATARELVKVGVIEL